MSEKPMLQTRIDYTSKPMAAKGLISYRYPSPDSWIMIGATDDQDALREANRSLLRKTAEISKLQKWDGSSYQPVTK